MSLMLNLETMGLFWKKRRKISNNLKEKHIDIEYKLSNEHKFIESDIMCILYFLNKNYSNTIKEVVDDLYYCDDCSIISGINHRAKLEVEEDNYNYRKFRGRKQKNKK